jgi:hypothetical protein
MWVETFLQCRNQWTCIDILFPSSINRTSIFFPSDVDPLGALDDINKPELCEKKYKNFFSYVFAIEHGKEIFFLYLSLTSEIPGHVVDVTKR